MKTSEQKGLLLGLIGVIIFGLTLPATRVAVSELDPFFIVYGRGILAGLAAASVLLAMRQPLPPREAWPRIAWAAACVVLGFPLFATLAMQYVPAAHGGVVLAILPLATALASVFFAAERPSTGFWICGIAGSIAVIAFTLLQADGAGGFHIADIFLFIAVASASAGYAIGGELSRRMEGWQVICWMLVIAAPVLFVAMLLQGVPMNAQASWRTWTAFLYLALFSQFIGFFAWYKGLALGGVAKVGQLQLLQAFVTFAAAVLLIGESVSWIEVAFACIVVMIVALGQRMRVDRKA